MSAKSFNNRPRKSKSTKTTKASDIFGSVYIRCTKRNLFCTLMDTSSGKVRTSCSLRVPPYENKYNERENLFKRGLLLGNLFADRTTNLGYTKVIIYLMGTSKARLGVVRGFNESKTVGIYSIVLWTSAPHNGCRPKKIRRKKLRSKGSR